MPRPTGIWYHWILLLRRASARRWEKRGRLPEPEEKLRAVHGTRRVHRAWGTRDVACRGAQLRKRPLRLASAWPCTSWRGPSPSVAAIVSRGSTAPIRVLGCNWVLRSGCTGHGPPSRGRRETLGGLPGEEGPFVTGVWSLEVSLTYKLPPQRGRGAGAGKSMDPPAGDSQLEALSAAYPSCPFNPPPKSPTREFPRPDGDTRESMAPGQLSPSTPCVSNGWAHHSYAEALSPLHPWACAGRGDVRGLRN